MDASWLVKNKLLQPKFFMQILLVYSGFTRRPSLIEPLLGFSKYTTESISYYNSRLPFSDMHLHGKHFDLVIFSTLFFSRRINKSEMSKDFKAVEWLKKLPAIKVATPQDEYINSKYVNEFFDSMNVKIIWSVQPENVWNKVYPDHKNRNIKIYHMLTGYLDDIEVKKVLTENMYSLIGRVTDIGYRTTGVPPAWNGRHTLLKLTIANEVKKLANSKGLIVDISTDSRENISEGWYKFLASCKYTIGVEGGTSINDYDGSIKTAVDAFVRTNPNATFEEIEQSCFPGMDGFFEGYAISPRHLEACLTKTCQILTDGDYGGVLIPWRHYIPLRKDFSNLDVVLDSLSDENLRISIVENAFNDIVKSGKFLNSTMVNNVINKSGVSISNDGNDVRNLFFRIINIIGEFYNSPNGFLVFIVEIFRRMKTFKFQ